jgi:hypothetical protein
VAFGLAVVGTFSVIAGVLFALARTVVAPLWSSMMGLLPTSLGAWVGLAFPPAVPICCGAIVQVWVGCTLYSWQRTALDLFSKA